jgi:hypothetical protein
LLSPDEAKSRLAERKDPDWKENRREELGRAGGDVTYVGIRLLTDRWDERGAARQHLAGLSDEDRRRLFEIFFPALAPWLEKTWRLLARLPYQVGVGRLPFRAPRSPDLAIHRRFEWLRFLVWALEGYDPEIRWLAAWAPHVSAGWSLDSVGVLLAAAVEEGGETGDEVFATLRDSASGTHEIGAMGDHVVSGLLCPDRPEAWRIVGDLLLAAQRQEGLRQAIMERADESHPGAFRHLLDLTLEHDLIRFSSVVRAADTWLGLQWDAANAGEVRRILERASACLEDPSAARDAIAGDESADIYYGLWSMAVGDVFPAIEVAKEVLADKSAERRFAAAHFLSRSCLFHAWESLVPLIDDPDRRVATLAAETLADGQLTEKRGVDVFAALARNIDRLAGGAEEVEAIVWPWCRPKTDRKSIAGALEKNLGDRSPRELDPFLSDLGPNARTRLVRRVGRQKELTDDDRAILLRFTGDKSADVQEEVFKRLKRIRVSPHEATSLESLLHRKAANLRRGVIDLLLNQSPVRALESADRLLADGKALKREAGLELLRRLSESGKKERECRERAERYRKDRGELKADERVHLDAILSKDAEPVTLEDGLGLYDPGKLAPVPDVVKQKLSLETRGAVAGLESLVALVHEHRTDRIVAEDMGEGWTVEMKDMILGEARWIFPAPKPGIDADADRKRLPLADLWFDWEETRGKKLRDRDGLELVRALLLTRIPPERRAEFTVRGVIDKLFGKKEIRVEYRETVGLILLWYLKLRPVEGTADLLLDALEHALAIAPRKDRKHWAAPWADLLHMVDRVRAFAPAAFDESHRVRLWRIKRWIEEWNADQKVDLTSIVDAWEAGVVGHADLVRHALTALRPLTSGQGADAIGKIPELKAITDRCRERVVEIELSRGDAPTPVSKLVRDIRVLPGASNLVRVLAAMKRGKFKRGWDWGEDRYGILSHLVRVSRPLPDDESKAFAALTAESGIDEKRLLELAQYAPQWADHVEAAVGWKGLADATWWIHAHTKDDHHHVDPDLLKKWEASVATRTALTADDLGKGEVDVAWFLRVYKTLKRAKWLKLYEAAKYASGAGGHKRAQLFSDAMLGRVTKTALKERIEEKRHQDAVRAYGLRPLARGKARDRDVLSRYQLMEEFARTSRQFGSQRQESERLAVRVGQANLARTAGYADPIRLRWAMEREEIADLAAGPVTVEVGDAAISLAIDEFGEPVVTVEKKGKVLKSIPAKARKDPKVKELSKRRTALRRQRSRIRGALESMMVRGDLLDSGELADLLGHPLIRPMLTSVVFVGDELVGYPIEDGKALIDHAGKVEPIGKADRIRIAHPQDFLDAGDWHLWQRECFARERLQPFKQVFRELYPMTDAEREETTTRRYAGHQVQPRQGIALLGGRGWVVSPEEGVRKTWHDEGITALLEFAEYFYTPADVEGLNVERVGFYRRGEKKLSVLGAIPPRLFSETMRDLDLLVSVAHMGGVDPEATASTVEMRSSLIRETLPVLSIANVRLKGNRALIAGKLGDYSVHLGSGVVHVMPGGFLCVVPIHSQHRGRLFLPFADDDPKTAEVISKVLLFARDEEIQDPDILGQIRDRRREG